jgi:hypothetical protein
VVYLNFKSGGIFKDGGKFKMAESLKWRKLQDGGISNMEVCLNIKDGGIFAYD